MKITIIENGKKRKVNFTHFICSELRRKKRIENELTAIRQTLNKILNKLENPSSGNSDESSDDTVNPFKLDVFPFL